MQIPDEFHDFCLYLHQDSAHVYGPEPRDWIIGALRHIDRKRHPALRAYVEELLNGNYTGKELQTIWNSTDAEMSARDERSLRNMLIMIRDAIDCGASE